MVGSGRGLNCTITDPGRIKENHEGNSVRVAGLPTAKQALYALGRLVEKGLFKSTVHLYLICRSPVLLNI